jgi:hypothetical protein
VLVKLCLEQYMLVEWPQAHMTIAFGMSGLKAQKYLRLRAG